MLLDGEGKACKTQSLPLGACSESPAFSKMLKNVILFLQDLKLEKNEAGQQR